MTTRTPDAVRKLHVALLDCPHCGSRPERRTRRKQKVVRCHAGSHLLEAIADSQREADDIWNAMASDWARKNTREGQAATAIQVLNAIANIQHIAGVVVNGSLNTHAHQLRECARILSAALDSRAGDAGEGFIVKLDNWMTVSVEDDGIILRNEAGEPIAFGKMGVDAKLPASAGPEPFGYWVEQKHADPVLLRKPACIPEASELRTVTPLYAAPAVDAVPAGEVDIWGDEVERFVNAGFATVSRNPNDYETVVAYRTAIAASLSHGEGRK